MKSRNSFLVRVCVRVLHLRNINSPSTHTVMLDNAESYKYLGVTFKSIPEIQLLITCLLPATTSRLHTTPCFKVVVVWRVVKLHDFSFLSLLPLLLPPPSMPERSGAYILACAPNRKKLYDCTLSTCANCCSSRLLARAQPRSCLSSWGTRRQGLLTCRLNVRLSLVIINGVAAFPTATPDRSTWPQSDT